MVQMEGVYGTNTASSTLQVSAQESLWITYALQTNLAIKLAHHDSVRLTRLQ
jgi:hypothetical protein